MNYGIPYKGSKNRIAEKVLSVLPDGNTLYDVFAGGCAVTDCALRNHKYKNYVINDVSDTPSLFLRALNGECSSLEWVSREDFFARKDTDPWVRCLWSFGNNGRDYIYSQAVEPYKQALHYAVCFGDFTYMQRLLPEQYAFVKSGLSKIDLKDTKARRIALGKLIVQWLKEYRTPEMLDSNPLFKQVKRSKKQSIQSLEILQSLERLQSLESLERLQSLERLERLQSADGITITAIQGDYQNLKFDDPDGVIYCDPPYKGTSSYGANGATDFNHNAFYDWCERQTLPVFVSEYDMPRDRFVCVAEFNLLSSICAKKSTTVVERIFRPKCQVSN